MDFDFPSDNDPRRSELRAWLAGHPSPTSAELHEAGLLVPHWPRPWGVEADPMHQLIIDEELKAAGVRETSVSTNPIGVGWAAPTILLAGTEWQKERFLPKIFSFLTVNKKHHICSNWEHALSHVQPLIIY